MIACVHKTHQMYKIYLKHYRCELRVCPLMRVLISSVKSESDGSSIDNLKSNPEHHCTD